MFILALLWIVLAFVIGTAAGSRGRNRFGWFLLALLLSPLVAGLLLAVFPDLRMRNLLEGKPAPVVIRHPTPRSLKVMRVAALAILAAVIAAAVVWAQGQ